MSKDEAIKHLQYRLSAISTNRRATWSLKDRAAVSVLCIDAAQHSVHPTASGVILVALLALFVAGSLLWLFCHGAW